MTDQPVNSGEPRPEDDAAIDAAFGLDPVEPGTPAVATGGLSDRAQRTTQWMDPSVPYDDGGLYGGPDGGTPRERLDAMVRDLGVTKPEPGDPFDDWSSALGDGSDRIVASPSPGASVGPPDHTRPHILPHWIEDSDVEPTPSEHVIPAEAERAIGEQMNDPRDMLDILDFIEKLARQKHSVKQDDRTLEQYRGEALQEAIDSLLQEVPENLRTSEVAKAIHVRILNANRSQLKGEARRVEREERAVAKQAKADAKVAKKSGKTAAKDAKSQAKAAKKSTKSANKATKKNNKASKSANRKLGKEPQNLAEAEAIYEKRRKKLAKKARNADTRIFGLRKTFNRANSRYTKARHDVMRFRLAEQPSYTDARRFIAFSLVDEYLKDLDAVKAAYDKDKNPLVLFRNWFERQNRAVQIGTGLALGAVSLGANVAGLGIAGAITLGVAGLSRLKMFNQRMSKTQSREHKNIVAAGDQQFMVDQANALLYGTGSVESDTNIAFSTIQDRAKNIYRNEKRSTRKKAGVAAAITAGSFFAGRFIAGHSDEIREYAGKAARKLGDFRDNLPFFGDGSGSGGSANTAPSGTGTIPQEVPPSGTVPESSGPGTTLPETPGTTLPDQPEGGSTGTPVPENSGGGPAEVPGSGDVPDVVTTPSGTTINSVPEDKWNAMTPAQHDQWNALTADMQPAERDQFADYLLQVDENRREFVAAQNYPAGYITEHPDPVNYPDVAATINIPEELLTTDYGSVREVARASWIDVTGRAPSAQELAELTQRYNYGFSSLIQDGHFAIPDGTIADTVNVPANFSEIQSIYEMYNEVEE